MCGADSGPTSRRGAASAGVSDVSARGTCIKLGCRGGNKLLTEDPPATVAQPGGIGLIIAGVDAAEQQPKEAVSIKGVHQDARSLPAALVMRQQLCRDVCPDHETNLCFLIAYHTFHTQHSKLRQLSWRCSSKGRHKIRPLRTFIAFVT